MGALKKKKEKGILGLMLNINMQQNNEGEKAKGGWVLCDVFWILFCGGSFFFLYISIKPKKFFITKNLVITYKLNTIEGFCHKVRDFIMVLVFLSFCHNPKGITKEGEEIEIKECVVGVNV